MKLYWSDLFTVPLLLALTSCGSEQFGINPQSTTKIADPLVSFQQLSCSSSTLVKPKVDILYVVDNSGSAFYFTNEIQSAITNTVNSISQQFDYRVIGIPLIAGTTNDYQVLTNSTEALPDSSKKIISTSQLSFFSNPGQQYSTEKGLGRTVDFINNSGNLFRNNAHLLIVLVSNGRDVEVELDPQGNGLTTQNTSLFNTRLNSFNSIKTSKNLAQLEFYPLTAHTNECRPDWRRSTQSYVAMANALGSTSYDLCTQSITNIFSTVNSTIQQEVIPHQYRFFPMTFAKDTDTRNTFGEIEVFKVSQNMAPLKLTDGTDYSYHYSGQGYEDTKELPAPAGERVYGRHFIRFNNLVTYPDCIQVKSVTKTEYFKYIIIPKEPKTSNPPITVYINGNVIPQSNSNGWSYRGNISVPNIKAAYPMSGDELPAIPKSGYMIELNGSSNYYKSGDSVQVNYVPAGV